LGAQQLDQLHTLLAQLRTEDCFRVLLIHHPLRSRAGAGHYKRLTDAVALREIIRVHGVELILHGHDHKHSVMWFDGPRQRIPALGVPSASARTDSHSDPAAYNLVRIERDGAAWHCDLQVRGFARGGDGIVNLQRERLF
jgi:3',5'-cyclic AMP phosphodiesterase CpdA